MLLSCTPLLWHSLMWSLRFQYNLDASCLARGWHDVPEKVEKVLTSTMDSESFSFWHGSKPQATASCTNAYCSELHPTNLMILLCCG